MNKATKEFSFKRGRRKNVWNFLFPLSVFLQLLTLTSCGQNKIVNRWAPAGHYSHGKLVNDESEGREYEFLKNGTLNIYHNGSVESSATYTMAADSKSISVKEGRTTGSIKIMKLAASELIMIFSPGKDTIVFYPSGSNALKQSQATAISHSELRKRWNNLLTEYYNRSDLISTLVKSVETLIDTKNEAYTKLITTQKEIYAPQSPKDMSSKEVFENFESLQAKYSKDIIIFMEFLKRNPKVLDTYIYSEAPKRFPDMEDGIQKARTEFIKAFNSYHGKKILGS